MKHLIKIVTVSLLLCLMLSTFVTALAGPLTDIRPVGVATKTIGDFEDCLPENSDSLLSGYLEKQIYESSGISPFAYKAGDLLTGEEKEAYDAVAVRLLEIASGQSTDATVVVEFKNDTTYGAEALKNAYEASNPGKTFPGIIVNRTITDAAMEAMTDVWLDGFDLYAVMVALLADFPYEMFWFNKTIGVAAGRDIKRTATGGYDCSASYMKSDSAVIYFNVAEEYAASSAYTLNTLPRKVATAVSNARAIVTVHENKSDYQRLLAYKDEICALVEYDWDAYYDYADKVSGGQKVYYIDPWQMISVFDGDETTNVVCEGYAKAFKYLCDLSGFDNIYCYTVTGDMNNGGHMWNVVEIDGANYLVDVTNSDQSGITNQLFLVGASEYVSPSLDSGSSYKIKTSLTNSILYTYDEDMKNLYGTGYLALAPSSYSPDNYRTLTVEGGSGSREYLIGAEVTISPTPSESQCFSIWQIVSGSIGSVDLTQSTLSFIMPKNDVKIKAVYTEHSTFADYDSTGHWKECIKCNAKVGKTVHSLEYENNSTKHWQKCSQCEYATTEQAHSFDRYGSVNATTHSRACVCGRNEGTEEHDFSTLKKNAQNHWYECACGRKNGTRAHTYAKAYDEDYHWDECACGQTSGTAAKHVYSSRITSEATEDKDGERTYFCLFCDREYKTVISHEQEGTEAPENSNNDNNQAIQKPQDQGATPTGPSATDEQNKGEVDDNSQGEGSSSTANNGDNSSQAVTETEDVLDLAGYLQACGSTLPTWSLMLLPVLAVFGLRKKKK